MLELYQFEMSQFSEKVRFLLDYKGLDYRKIEVTPGIGQVEVFQLSGQRQVPVLKDGSTVIADSTEIALYLERTYPDKPLLPGDPVLRGQCLMMEEWADESLGRKGRKVLLGALNQYPQFRASFLPKEVPDILKNLVGTVPGDFFGLLGTGVGLGNDVIKAAQRGIKQDLEALSLILSDRPYLLGDQPSLADFTVAALSIILKSPEGNYLDVPAHFLHQGIPGIADQPAYEPFFVWRDRLYRDFRKPLSTPPQTNSNSNDRPTTIEIE